MLRSIAVIVTHHPGSIPIQANETSSGRNQLGVLVILKPTSPPRPSLGAPVLSVSTGRCHWSLNFQSCLLDLPQGWGNCPKSVLPQSPEHIPG